MTVSTQGDLSAVNPQGSVTQGAPTKFAPGPSASTAVSSDVAALRVLGRMAIEHERARTMHVEDLARHGAMIQAQQSEMAVERERHE